MAMSTNIFANVCNCIDMSYQKNSIEGIQNGRCVSKQHLIILTKNFEVQKIDVIEFGNKSKISFYGNLCLIFH